MNSEVRAQFNAERTKRKAAKKESERKYNARRVASGLSESSGESSTDSEDIEERFQDALMMKRRAVHKKASVVEPPVALIAQMPVLAAGGAGGPAPKTQIAYTQRSNKIKKESGVEISNTGKMTEYIQSKYSNAGTQRNYFSALAFETKDTPAGEHYRQEVLKLKS